MADTSVKVSFIGDAKKLKSTIDGVDKDINDLGKSSKSFGSKFTDGFSKALPVLAGVGAGIAVLGSALKAAVEDEAEQKRLATTLIQVAGATKEQIAATEKWIDVTQRATGVADSQLRPALDKLVRSSSSVEEAQKNLSIAMDVSQGTGKDLDTVAQALAKVLEGNTGAASKLVPELAGIAREGASADEVMAALATTFKDQTANHANTSAGKLERMNIAFDEMKERVGTALLPKLTEFGNWMLETGIPKMEEMATKVSVWWEKQDGLREAIGTTVDFIKAEVEGIIILIGWIEKLVGWVDKFQDKLGTGNGTNPFAELQSRIPITTGGEEFSHQPNVRTGGESFIPGLASGGIVTRPTLALIGERGPEAVVPLSRGAGGGDITLILMMDEMTIGKATVRASDRAGGLPIRIRAAS